jgi:hypothetical protein
MYMHREPRTPRHTLPAAVACLLSIPAFGATSDLTLNVSAKIVTGPQGASVLWLTPAQEGQAGSAFTTNSVAFSPKYIFSTFFQFQMTDPGPGGASDGMTFTLQTESATALGANGGDLGYLGITPSVAVELNTWQNAPFDINDNDVAVLTNADITGLDPQTPYGVTNCQPTGRTIEIMYTLRCLLPPRPLAGLTGGRFTANAADAPSASGVDLKAMDTTVNPCQNFYQYACGAWRKNNPIPPDQSRWARFNELAERNLAIERGILEKPGDSQIGDFYAACMDEPAIERKGIQPIEPLLKQIDALASKRELAGEMVRLHGRRARSLQFLRAPDDKKSDQEIATWIRAAWAFRTATTI